MVVAAPAPGAACDFPFLCFPAVFFAVFSSDGRFGIDSSVPVVGIMEERGGGGGEGTEPRGWGAGCASAGDRDEVNDDSSTSFDGV